MAAKADTHEDSRFDEAEADVDHGTPWKYRDPDAPNPLTVLAAGWFTGHTRLGEAEFLQGTDRGGKKWNVLVGGSILTKRLLDGVVEEWDDEKQAFVAIKTEGRVQPGEVVSIKYKGDREGAQYDYPDFDVARKPPATQGEDGVPY